MISVWLTLGLILVTQGGGTVFRSLVSPSKTRPARQRLATLPTVFGSWTGKDAVLDPRTVQAVGSDDQVSRSYSDPSGNLIQVHCATWISSDPAMPHGPQECYSTNGWTLRESRSSRLPNHPNSSVAIQKYEQSGHHVMIAWWYQMDDSTFIDWSNGRRLHRRYWGKGEWPPLTKVLLQGEDSDQAEAWILQIADHIYEFNCRL